METERERHKPKRGREMDGKVGWKWGKPRKEWIGKGLKTAEKIAWTDSSADQKER